MQSHVAGIQSADLPTGAPSREGGQAQSVLHPCHVANAGGRVSRARPETRAGRRPSMARIAGEALALDTALGAAPPVFPYWIKYFLGNSM